MIFTHHPRVSLARLTFCWWRHNRLAMTSQWPDNCDANTWQVISNSLNIDFIHGDIHGRSCKKIFLFPAVSATWKNQTFVWWRLDLVIIPDSKFNGANVGPIWDRQNPGGPHVGPMNFAVWDCFVIQAEIEYIFWVGISYLIRPKEWDNKTHKIINTLKTLSNEFTSLKIFWLKFYRNLFPGAHLAMSQHWFR